MLEEFQAKFKAVIYYCLDMDLKPSEFSQLPVGTRYMAYINHINPGFRDYTATIKYIPTPLDKKPSPLRCDTTADIPHLFDLENIAASYNEVNTGIMEFFDESKTIPNLMFAEFIKMLENDVRVKKCENCLRYFIPKTKKETLYCDRVISGNITCKKVGYESKLKSDDLLDAFRKEYKIRNAKKKRNGKNIHNSEELFNEWVVKAKKELLKAQEGEISHDDFKKWLKPSDCLIRPGSIKDGE